MHFVNAMAARAIPLVPRRLIERISRRYIAGSDLSQAISRIQQLNAEGYPVTVDVLGEQVSTAVQADAVLTEYEAVLDAIDRCQLDATVSVKPTAMGLQMDGQACSGRIERLLVRAQSCGTGVCLDMEDASCTQLEIDLFHHLAARHGNLAIAVQAYLQRSYDDLEHLLKRKAQIRICKGIYAEDRTHLVERAAEDRSAINPHFLAHAVRCFESGMYVSIATHDRTLVTEILGIAKRLGISANRFEFQMLLGVCEPLRDELRAMGFQVRIYVPFGKDWYGYSVRRIKESPRIAGYLLREMAGL